MDSYVRDNHEYQYISPSNIMVNNFMKNKIISKYQKEVGATFAVPMACSLLELMYLGSNPQIAKHFRLAKWASLSVSVVYLHYITEKLNNRTKYYDFHYPYPSKAQEQNMI